jgi:hypothetical protein
VAETANGAVLAAGAETQDTESLGNDNTLLLVVGRGDTLEDLEALHSGGTTGGLVGNHAADGLVKDAGRSAEVEGTTTGGVETSHLAKVGVVLDYISGIESVFLIYPKNLLSSRRPVVSVLYLFALSFFPSSTDRSPKITEKMLERGLNVRFARKNSPEMLRASHLTTTIF